MEYPPCLNPSCKSHGRPHPNCRCHSEQALADGGEVSHFCSQDMSHMPDCEYFAEGGSIPEGAISIDQFQPAQSHQPAQELPEGAIPMDKFQSHEDKYGSTGQQAIAGLEGAAKGLAGPLATAVERTIGVPGEDIEGRAEENPITHYVAEAAGFVAPALLSGGASSLTQVGALAKAGEAFAGAVGATSTAGKLAAKLGIENALYTVGDEVSKALVNDPSTIQAAAIHVGLSGLIGAGSGGILGKVSDAWVNKIGPKAETFVKDFTDRLKSNGATPEPPTPPPAAPIPEAGIASEGGPFKNFPPKPGTPLSAEAPLEEAVEAPKPKLTLGQKAADFISDKAEKLVSETLGTAAGAAMGKMTGVPGAGWLGAYMGRNSLKPVMETILPSIIKPILQSEASAAGMRAAFDVIDAVAKGNALADTAVKSLFEVGTSGAMNLHDLDTKREELDKLDEKVAELHKNPDALLNTSGDLGHYMPQHQTALSTTTQTILNYLSAQKPQPLHPGVLDTPIPPPQSAQNDYYRLLGLAEQPLSILSLLKRGNLTPKDVINLKAMYPALHPKLLEKLQHQMIDSKAKGQAIPFKLRGGLSILTGQPMDSTFTAPSVQAIQATYLPQPSSNQAGEGAKKKSTAKLGKTADLARTDNQARIQALQKA